MDQLLKALSPLYDLKDEDTFPQIESVLKKLGGWQSFHPMMALSFLTTMMNNVLVNFIIKDLGEDRLDPAASPNIFDKLQDLLTVAIALQHMIWGFAKRYVCALYTGDNSLAGHDTVTAC